MASTLFTIGVVDEEKKERHRMLNFFEDKFNVVEIASFSSIEDLIKLIKSETIDALAIDYKLKEHGTKFKENGDVIFKELSEKLKDFPSFIITSDSKAARTKSKTINSFLIIDKSQIHLPDGKEKTKFLKDIETNIKSYHTKIEEKKTRLKKLEALKKKGTLTAPMENEYLTLINELAKETTGISAIPLKYFSRSTDEKLNRIISKTDSLIKKFSKD